MQGRHFKLMPIESHHHKILPGPADDLTTFKNLNFLFGFVEMFQDSEVEMRVRHDQCTPKRS